MQKEKRKYTIGGVLGGIILVLIIGGSMYEILKPQIASFAAEWRLREYNDDIEKCVSQAKDSGDKTIDIKYTCAIKTASSFYDSDPEKAIQLCMINNPFFDIKLGREYSNLDPDDVNAQKNENIARASCKSSIEKSKTELELESTSRAEEKTEVTTKDVTKDTDPKSVPVLSNDSIFSNEKYDYTFSLLTTEKVMNNKNITGEDEFANVPITDEEGNFLASITVLDPDLFPGDQNKKIRESFSLPLKQYVEHISELNKDTLDLSMQESKQFGDISGYTISIMNIFTDEKGKIIFGDNYPVHSFVFLEYKGLKYQLEFPESLGHRGMEILKTLKFN